jgi:hypothetical protein
MRNSTPPFPLSIIVSRFVDRLTALSSEQWETIKTAIAAGGIDVPILEASRNAAIALAVRDLITREQFEHLYRPFSVAIPTESLDKNPELD